MRSILIISTIVVFISCKQNSGKQTGPVEAKDSVATIVIKKDFSNLQFASKKDLSCGMPLSAGLEDTAHYKGNIYGFCSPECKADFVKNAKTYVKE